MKQKSILTLDKEFILYCELNNIDNVEKLANDTFNRGFALLKYGETPKGTFEEKVIEVEVIKEVIVEKIVNVPYEVIKEVIVEKIIEVPIEVVKEVIKEVKVEVPIEVIKEVKVKGKNNTITKEIIKEVPVEVIKEVIVEKIVEVPVEKIVEKKVEIVNTIEIDKLKEENEKLKKELEAITTSLGKFTKAKFMKSSDLSNLYDE